MEMYTIQVTNEELGILGQALRELPYKLSANLIVNISQQIQRQEAERAQHQSEAGKANGGGSPRSEVRTEGGDTAERGEGV